MSSALNSHAAFALPSHQPPFCSGKGSFAPQAVSRSKGRALEENRYPFRLFSERPLPSTWHRFPKAPVTASPPGPIQTSHRSPEQVRSATRSRGRAAGSGEEGGGGERGAQPIAPPGLGSGNARPRGARAAASGRRPRVRASCRAARQETASHRARGWPGRRRGPRREGAWGGRGVSFLPMPGAT